MSEGFTLLEALLATIILVGGVISVVWAFNAGIFATGDVEHVDLALNIAQAKLEELKEMPFASLANEAASPDGEFSDFNIAVDVNKGNDPMQVDVTVSWQEKGEAVNIVLSTLRADY